jgi:hypothetical protein
MAPKEKAIELRNKFRDVRWDIDPDTSKQCALIAIDEIMDVLRLTEKIQQHPIGVWKAQEYWQEVKQEIERL